MYVIGALCLIAAMYVWMIRSNRRHHRQMERRRHGWNTRIPDGETNVSLESFESDLAEWVRADHEEKLR
jgi:hypothetical protein